MSIKKKYFVFGLIILLNIILKVFYCDLTPFSYDEIISVKNSLLDFGHIKHQSEWDNNPPLFYYCIWVWHKFLPISEINSRLLSVLFVSMAIGLTFLFCLKYFSNRTAILSSVILSLSNFLNFYSQETRTYSLVLLLALISSLQFFKYLNKPSLVNLLLLSSINFLIIYSHYIAGLIIFTQFFFVVIYFRKYIPVYLTVQSSIIIALVFFRFTRKQFDNILGFNSKDDFWLQKANLHDLTNCFSELFFGSIISIVFLIAAVLFIYENLKVGSYKSPNVEMYCLLLGYLVVLILYAVGTFKAVFLPRYLIFCVPFAVIIFSNRIFRGLSGNLVGLTFIGLLLCDVRLVKPTDSNYKTVAEIVIRVKSDDDCVIINTRDNLLLFAYYYRNDYFLKYENLDSIFKTHNIYGINTLSQLESIAFEPNKKLFLLQSFHKLHNQSNPVYDFLQGRFNSFGKIGGIKGVEFSLFKTK